MRVLFVANPEKAHLMAMVPLAWALRTAGHEVLFAVQPAFAKLITQAGLTAVPVGRDVDLWQLIPRHPDLRDWTWDPAYGLPAPYDVADGSGKASWEYMHEGYVDAVNDWHKPACFPMIAALVDFARSWKPDLVVWEPLALAGPIAAKACGAAHARLLWSIDVFGITRQLFVRVSDGRADPLGEWLAAYARKHGFDYGEDMVTGQFTIDQLPGSLRMQADLDYLPMQYIPYGGPATIPDWLKVPAKRPRVALTMGLSLTDHEAGYSVGVQKVLDDLATLDIEVVATLAETEQKKLTRLPENVRVVSYAPLQALASTCDAVISHGGFGTFLTVARYAVPQLATAWDFDGPAFAALAARQGSTLAVRADQAIGPVVREAVQRLLNEPSFGERAAALRDEIHHMPTPNQVVAQLEDITAEFRAAVR